MMLKVNDEFLDFNGIVELDQQVKLFEEIDSTMGDFSYVFNLSKTAKNMRILGNPMADVKNKIIYNSVNCDLLDESGITLHKGFLRVERINTHIECSFFSGNYNWIALLEGPLSDADFSEHDVDLTEANIINSLLNKDGIIFPFLDSGVLVSRSSANMKVEDFTGCFYVKTIFNKIFSQVGIKLNGELITDPIYDSLLVANNNQDKNAIDARSAFAVKTVDEPIGGTSRVEFEDDSTFPYFDGSQGNFSTASHRYNADVRMLVRIEVTLRIDSGPSVNFFQIRKNGVTGGAGKINVRYETAGGITSVSGGGIMLLDAGEYADVNSPFMGPGESVLAGSTFKVTPIYIYKVFGNTAVPNMSKRDFVSSILSIFNVVSDYDPFNKELTFNYFDRIKHKQPIDISEHINVVETDFEEFISGFAKNNILSYEESDDEDLREYNVNEFFKYGNGNIQTSNSFLEESKDIVDSPFKAPISYIHPSFAASTEKLNFVETEEEGQTEFTGVTDSSGEAVFAINEDIFSDVDLVRIEDSTQPEYNGEWIVRSVAPGSIRLEGVFFSSNATGKITRLRHSMTTSEDVFLLISCANANQTEFLNVSDFSKISRFSIEENSYSVMAYAYFSLLNLGLNINDWFNQSLSFGEINDPLFYQRTMIESYWSLVGLILNDPVKLRCEGTIPKVLFNNITPLQPVTIKTVESSNLYYLNKISGYTDSAVKCSIELIKLS